MDVLDGRGMRWTIERRFAPWRRVVRPVSLVTGRYPSDVPVWPVEEPPAQPRGRLSRREKAVVAALAPLALLDVLRTVAAYVFGGLLALPVVALELVVLGAAGSVLGLLRLAGLARYRVEVTCRTGHLLHAETVLLVRGRRRARQLVEELAARRRGATRSFWPTRLAAGVSVRSHRSIWQASANWIGGRDGQGARRQRAALDG
jgi:hypothetical protein